jgi:hypothetical protein
MHDVTGAGVLDLGNVDQVLKLFWRHFAKGKVTLAVKVSVAAARHVQDCRSDLTKMPAAAGEAVAARRGGQAAFRALA